MNAPRWMKFIKDAWAFDAKMQSAVTKDKAQIVALTSVTTVNASDLATAIALANANKIAINAVIAALKA